MRTLGDWGFTRLVVVVGHESEAIQDYLGDRRGNMAISYITSTRYRTTNNIYSLWLAREAIDEPFLLLESDLVFEPSLLEGLLSPDTMAISRQLPWMNGTTVTLGGGGVAAFCLGEMSRADATRYKTVNIYSFAAEHVARNLRATDGYIAAKRTGDYYESVFAEMVADKSLALSPVLFDSDAWYEIDTLDDLAAAEALFPRYSATLRLQAAAALGFAGQPVVVGQQDEERTVGSRSAAREVEYEALQSEHGGYWRHDFVDHAYLYNLHFPPQSMFDAFAHQIHQLVLNYPVAQDVVAGLVGTLIGQSPELIVVGNGAAELIKILSGSVARKLIVPVPSFNEYANAAPAGSAVEFPLTAPSFELDVERFAAEAIRARADVAVVVTPNNPTSLSVSRADLLRLLGLLAPHDCMLVVDESFIDFAASGAADSVERDILDHHESRRHEEHEQGVRHLRAAHRLSADRQHRVRVAHASGAAYLEHQRVCRVVPAPGPQLPAGLRRELRGRLGRARHSLRGSAHHSGDDGVRARGKLRLLSASR